jgi:Nuclease-related domain
MRELIKGSLGEKMTTFGMWLKLDQEIYRRIHNVILPARNGTTQIDHVVISIYGLFCDRNEKHRWMDFRLSAARDVDAAILQKEV